MSETEPQAKSAPSPPNFTTLQRQVEAMSGHVPEAQRELLAGMPEQVWAATGQLRTAYFKLAEAGPGLSIDFEEEERRMASAGTEIRLGLDQAKRDTAIDLALKWGLLSGSYSTPHTHDDERKAEKEFNNFRELRGDLDALVRVGSDKAAETIPDKFHKAVSDNTWNQDREEEWTGYKAIPVIAGIESDFISQVSKGLRQVEELFPRTHPVGKIALKVGRAGKAEHAAKVLKEIDEFIQGVLNDPEQRVKSSIQYIALLGDASKLQQHRLEVLDEIIKNEATSITQNLNASAEETLSKKYNPDHGVHSEPEAPEPNIDNSQEKTPFNIKNIDPDLPLTSKPGEDIDWLLKRYEGQGIKEKDAYIYLVRRMHPDLPNNENKKELAEEYMKALNDWRDGERAKKKAEEQKKNS
jgi:hypothetical protein